MVARELFGQLAAQLSFVVYDRLPADAHARALAARLGEQGERQVVVQRFVRALEHLECRRRQVVERQHPLGHRLVQRQGQVQHPAARVGHAQHLEQGGHVRLARIAPVPLADVEADIGLQPGQFVDQRQVAFQKRRAVSPGLQGRDDRIDRHLRVKVIPRIGGHPLVTWRVLLQVRQHGDIQTHVVLLAVTVAHRAAPPPPA